MPDQILLSEWAGDLAVPRLLGAGDGRTPCPVCGHPTGDCTNHPPQEASNIMAETQKKAGAKSAEKDHADLQQDAAPEVASPDSVDGGVGVGDDAVVIKSDGSVDDSLFASTEDGEQYVTLAKDVVEEFYFPGTKRPSYRLLYTKGQVVRKSAVEARNARSAAPSGDLSAEEQVRAQTDASTLAAGTWPGPEDAKAQQK